MTTLLVPMHYENDSLMMFLGSMKVQTDKNFKVWILHNGSNTEAKEMVEILKDDRFEYYETEDSGYWGCINRKEFIQKVDTEFVHNTSVQDYYPPIFIETINKYDEDFLIWNGINHIFGYHGVLNAQPQVGQVDWGNFRIRTSIAKRVGINFPKEFCADGFFVRDLFASGLIKSQKKLQEILSIHN